MTAEEILREISKLLEDAPSELIVGRLEIRYRQEVDHCLVELRDVPPAGSLDTRGWLIIKYTVSEQGEVKINDMAERTRYNLPNHKVRGLNGRFLHELLHLLREEHANVMSQMAKIGQADEERRKGYVDFLKREVDDNE